MSYRIVKTEVYRCKCDVCAFVWDEYRFPQACPKCRKRTWNGEDKRRGMFKRQRVARAAEE